MMNMLEWDKNYKSIWTKIYDWEEAFYYTKSLQSGNSSSPVKIYTESSKPTHIANNFVR